MADKEGRSTIGEINPLWLVVIGMIVFIGIYLVSSIAGFFFYQEETFTATVSRIEHYGVGGFTGGTKTTVHFDDGRVYDAWEIPELREGQKYTIEYRTPYFIKEPYLVIISGGHN